MKNIVFIAICFCLVFLTSCTSDYVERVEPDYPHQWVDTLRPPLYPFVFDIKKSKNTEERTLILTDSITQILTDSITHNCRITHSKSIIISTAEFEK